MSLFYRICDEDALRVTNENLTQRRKGRREQQETNLASGVPFLIFLRVSAPLREFLFRSEEK
jgi:hypothetical protein